MARPTTLPDQSNAVEHLPTQLPAVQVTLPEVAADHISDIDFSHLPEWFPLVSAQTATAQDHPPTEIPPPPPVDVTLPAAAVEHLTQLPEVANIPDWFIL
jgi:hypothetical protein